MEENRREHTMGCRAPADIGARCLLSTECDLGDACLRQPDDAELLEREARRAGWRAVVLALLWAVLTIMLGGTP